MARHSYSSNNADFGLLVLFAVLAWQYWKWILVILSAVLVLEVIVLVVRTLWPRHCSVSLAHIDVVSGLDFEQYIANLLTQRGFTNVSLTEQYDLGIDIIAEKNGVRWGVQVKRYNSLVKVSAVRQAVTALRFYGCDRAMVITNSTYSNVAKQLAKSNDCVLVDRGTLQKTIRR